MKIPARHLIAALAVVLLASCETNTMPTASDMDRFYAKAEQMAQERIKLLEERKRNGEITPAEFETQSAAVRDRVLNHATELAWARHESVEARRRAMGIPTGDHPVQITVPNTGNGESFYRRAGEQGGENFYSNAPYGGSVLGGPNRGERPRQPERDTPVAQPNPVTEAVPQPEAAAPPQPIVEPVPQP